MGVQKLWACEWAVAALAFRSPDVKVSWLILWLNRIMSSTPNAFRLSAGTPKCAPPITCNGSGRKKHQLAQSGGEIWRSDCSLNWLLTSLLFFFFNRLYFFKSSFRFTARLSRKYRDFSHAPCSPSKTAPTINIPRVVQLMNLHLTHHCHPKSIVYIRVCPGWRTFYDLRQMYTDMYLPL